MYIEYLLDVEYEYAVRRRNNPKSFRRWASMDLPNWEEAACREKDPELFFVERYEGRKIPAAKKICSSCSIRLRCLNYAMKWEVPYGIWGGTTAQERVYLKKSLGGRKVK